MMRPPAAPPLIAFPVPPEARMTAPQDASTRLRRRAAEVMNRWVARAIVEVGAAGDQASLALRNSLPEYLELLADALSKTRARTDANRAADRIDSERVGREHGHERATSPGYTVDQLIFEYHILRQVICQVLEEDAPLTPTEREIITLSIEQAVNDAASQFSDTLRNVQQHLTRALAHDLRGPMTAARLHAEYILRSPDDVERCVESAVRIVESMDRLETMTTDILDAGLLRAGYTLPLQLSECDLERVLHEAVAAMLPADPTRLVLDTSGPCIGWWDRDALRRIVDNLVSNAFKYGAPHTPVTLRLDQSPEDATVSVHNAGRPIPPDEQALFFQQFRRTRPAAAPGWGLGLTIVKGLTEAHGGRVDVDSREGYGTTFSVTLPKRSAAAPAR